MLPGFEQIAERLRRSTVQVLNGGGGGSGVVWDQEGTIVTNAHVARGNDARIIDARGRRFRARVTRKDPDCDLALLESDASDLEPAAITSSASLKVGQIVLAAGNPLGITGAVAAGMIHAIGPLDAAPPEFAASRPWIQADVRLAPGNSGGALADAAGRVIGINTMVFHGIGLAVPSDQVRRFLSGAPRLRLGVEMMSNRDNLIVVRIEQGSLAEHAGILIGDVILCRPAVLRQILAAAEQSGWADLPITRGGRKLTLRLDAHDRSEAEAA